MANHKLLCLLKSLSPKELKSMRDFIYSPFFNKSKKVIKLFDVLITYYPDFDFGGITKETLHYKLFPGIKYNDATFRHLISDLFSLAERFLVEINLNKLPVEKLGYLIEEYQNRQTPNLIEGHLKLIHDHYSAAGDLGSTACLNLFKYETLRFNYVSSMPDAYARKSISDTISVLNSRNKYLLVFFITELIKCADTINIVTRKNNIFLNQNLTTDLFKKLDIEKLLLFLIKHKELNDYSGILKTYYKLYRLNSQSDADIYFFDLKKEIKTNIDQYSFEETGFFYKKLVDFCIKKIKSNKSKVGFDIELFDIYNDILKLKLFMNEQTNTIPSDLFRNILILSLRLKKTAWAEDFIKNYSVYLPSGLRPEITFSAYAALYFEKQDFDRALYYINRVKLTNISIKLDIKSLLLKIYYELSYDDSFSSLCDAYRELLKRNHGIPHQKLLSHKEFINFTEQLLSFKTNGDILELYILRKKIEGSEPFINKNWLLQKTDLVIREKEKKVNIRNRA